MESNHPGVGLPPPAGFEAAWYIHDLPFASDASDSWGSAWGNQPPICASRACVFAGSR
jgi:hypothetical protein